MGYWKILISFFLLVSCYEPKEKEQINTASNMIVEDYTGNAIIFFYTQRFGDKVYLFQIKDDDSSKFKNGNVERYIKNNISIQMRIGESRMLEIMSEQASKHVMVYKACNLPYDSMCYVRAFIRYKNFTEILLNVNDKKSQKNDSCKTVLISSMKDDSGIDSFYIYR
jgi:hypothetical protein